MTRAHLRRYGALDPPCHATRDTIGPTNFRLRAQTWPRTPPTRVRLACGHRAPPRSWTLLLALAGFLRQAASLAAGRRGEDPKVVATDDLGGVRGGEPPAEHRVHHQREPVVRGQESRARR